jgi:hypothetical protein
LCLLDRRRISPSTGNGSFGWAGRTGKKRGKRGEEEEEEEEEEEWEEGKRREGWKRICAPAYTFRGKGGGGKCANPAHARRST